MTQYRKKPATIEAVQFDGLNPTEIKDFVGENCEVEIYDNEVTPPIARIIIHTLEGDMEVSKGDYVIKGVKGEFYPCKPDIFKQTYESADITSDLEEAAEEYRKESHRKSVLPNIDGPMPEYGGSIKDAFIAGAEREREQMLKEALEWLKSNTDKYIVDVGVGYDENGRKVELIIGGKCWEDFQKAMES